MGGVLEKGTLSAVLMRDFSTHMGNNSLSDLTTESHQHARRVAAIAVIAWEMFGMKQLGGPKVV